MEVVELVCLWVRASWTPPAPVCGAVWGCCKCSGKRARRVCRKSERRTSSEAFDRARRWRRLTAAMSVRGANDAYAFNGAFRSPAAKCRQGRRRSTISTMERSGEKRWSFASSAPISAAQRQNGQRYRRNARKHSAARSAQRSGKRLCRLR